jgi:hypothetical protein
MLYIRGGVVILIGTVVRSAFGVCFYCDGCVFIMRANMGLCISAKLSFICNTCLLKLYIQKCSSIFNDCLFFSLGMNSNVWSVVPMCVMCWVIVFVVRILNLFRLSLRPGYVLHTGLWKYIAFVRYTWVDIYCILIHILGLNCVYFFLLILGVLLLCW